VPTHDEHGVRNTHPRRITHIGAVCPVGVRHIGGNRGLARPIPGSPVEFTVVTATAPGLALADPAQRRLGRHFLYLR